MGGSYSQDLRDRVIDAVVREGMSRRAAEARFGVSESAAIKWVARFLQSGSRASGKMGGHKRVKLASHRAFLERLRAEKPDITLQALCDQPLDEHGLKADASVMSRFFRRIGVTFKKRRSSRAPAVPAQILTRSQSDRAGLRQAQNTPTKSLRAINRRRQRRNRKNPDDLHAR
jgi:putative transposase